MVDVHPFFARQHELLNHMEQAVAGFQQDVEQARTEHLDALRARREQAANVVEARRTEVAQAQNRVKAHVEAKKAHTATAIQEWKARRQAELLELRADDAESYADAATAVAEAAIEEARAAALEAIEARREADEAASRTGAGEVAGPTQRS
jgi:hypothetical protein